MTKNENLYRRTCDLLGFELTDYKPWENIGENDDFQYRVSILPEEEHAFAVQFTKERLKEHFNE